MDRQGVLLVEDDPGALEMGLYNLTGGGYAADGAGSGEEALEMFDPSIHQVVVTDVRMPGMSGMELLAKVKERAPETPVLVVTAYANVELAVEAMKAGAFDFIGKPFNRDHLLLAVEKALESRRLRSEVERLRKAASPIHRPLVYRSKAMASIVRLADKVAPSTATVLIMGESGTGKELLARRIHLESLRAKEPFVAVNCAAVSPALLESELFGHTAGAFTGATEQRTGRFRQADGGTLFLDEVGDLSLDLQAKLLRALQERAVDVVGRDEPVPVDVRVVAATNHDLNRQMAEGGFRRDLYYRLNVVEVFIPPLRQRPEDIEPLVRHFVELYGGDRVLEISPRLIEEMERRAWPGNVRELANVCERLVLLASGEVLRPEDLPSTAPGGLSQQPTGESVRSAEDVFEQWPPLPPDGLPLLDLEKKLIERVLKKKGWNVSQAAAYLNVPRHVLSYRMSKYGIERPDDT